MLACARKRERRGALSSLPASCRAVAAALLGLPLSGCAALNSGFLVHPGGPIAFAERHEFWVVGAILLLVFLPVAVLTPLIAWHYRLANTKSAFRPQWGFSWILEVLIWVPPTLIVLVLSVLLSNNTHRLDPYRPLPGPQPLRIEAVSLDWKWLFIYPDQDIALVNQLVLPVGRPIAMTMTSGTVMQSLLMPRLAGQIFTMAGMRTRLHLKIDHPGLYWGENTQYNGDGFPSDKFEIHGVTPTAFAKWTAQVQANPATLNARAYQTLSRQSVIEKPLGYGHVESGLFAKIVGQTITPGYVIQHHESQESKDHA